MRALLILLPLLTLAACATTPHERRATPDLLGEAGAPPGSLETNRSIVRNAMLEVERKDPDQGPAQVVALAKARGGYAEKVMATAVTVRIPAEKLDGFLGDASTLGKVSRRSVTADDVTQVHQDLKVRLDNVSRARERYLELLQKAVSVEDTIKVEKELERVTLQYETLKAQLDGLEGQVSLATAYVEFTRPVRPGPLGWVFYGLGKAVKWLFVWD